MQLQYKKGGVMTGESGNIERRIHKRYALRNTAFALDISRTGNVLNIGNGGLAFSYVSKIDWLHSHYPDDPGVLLVGDEILMVNIRFKVVSQSSKVLPFNHRYLIRLGLKFEGLSNAQAVKLEEFIAVNACQEV